MVHSPRYRTMCSSQVSQILRNADRLLEIITNNNELPQKESHSPSDANSIVFLYAFSCISNAFDHNRVRTRLLYSVRIGMGTTFTVSLNNIFFVFLLGLLLLLLLPPFGEEDGDAPAAAAPSADKDVEEDEFDIETTDEKDRRLSSSSSVVMGLLLFADVVFLRFDEDDEYLASAIRSYLRVSV